MFFLLLNISFTVSQLCSFCHSHNPIILSSFLTEPNKNHDLILKWATQWVTLVKQYLVMLLEDLRLVHPRGLMMFVSSFILYVVFCGALFIFSSFFFLPLFCLSFDLWLLISPFVSSILSYYYRVIHDKLNRNRGRRDHDRMVVGFTTTYAISAFHQWLCC